MISIEKSVIEIKDNGPYEVIGSFKVVDADGNSFSKNGDISLCRCGYSDEKPFCDGTHKEIDFQSAPRVNELMVEV